MLYLYSLRLESAKKVHVLISDKYGLPYLIKISQTKFLQVLNPWKKRIGILRKNSSNMESGMPKSKTHPEQWCNNSHCFSWKGLHQIWWKNHSNLEIFQNPQQINKIFSYSISVLWMVVWISRIFGTFFNFQSTSSCCHDLKLALVPKLCQRSIEDDVNK